MNLSAVMRNAMRRSLEWGKGFCSPHRHLDSDIYRFFFSDTARAIYIHFSPALPNTEILINKSPVIDLGFASAPNIDV
jgi:hypothetical protein